MPCGVAHGATSSGIVVSTEIGRPGRRSTQATKPCRAVCARRRCKGCRVRPAGDVATVAFPPAVGRRAAHFVAVRLNAYTAKCDNTLRFAGAAARWRGMVKAMGREAGNTQGFGRVSPVTRPSPYSPVQFRGGGAGAPAPQLPAAPRRVVGRAAVIGAALAAVAGVVAWFAIAPAPVPATHKISAPVAPAPAAADERGSKPRVSTTLPQPGRSPRT